MKNRTSDFEGTICEIEKIREKIAYIKGRAKKEIMLDLKLAVLDEIRPLREEWHRLTQSL